MEALELLEDLESQGLRFRWGQRGVSVTGDLGKLTLDYRRLIGSREEEFGALIRWRTLQDESEARFGWPGARLYPFLSLSTADAPVIRTSKGPARLERVLPDGCDVVLESDREHHERADSDTQTNSRLKMTRLTFDNVFPSVVSSRIDTLGVRLRRGFEL